VFSRVRAAFSRRTYFLLIVLLTIFIDVLVPLFGGHNFGALGRRLSGVVEIDYGRRIEQFQRQIEVIARKCQITEICYNYYFVHTLSLGFCCIVVFVMLLHLGFSVLFYYVFFSFGKLTYL